MPLTRDSLKQYFTQGFKKPDDLQVGVEWEKIGVYRKSLKAIRYSGPRGVEVIFNTLVRRNGWEPVRHGTHIIALKKGRASITLEPGGQIELSGQKSRSLDKNASELRRHLKEIKKISDPLGIVWLGLGLQPISTHQEIQWVPKKRYQIMKEVLKNKGPLTYAMMKETASVQISLDYTSEHDAIKKLRLGLALSPILTAIYANSPISKGRLNGFYSRRAYIWRHTAPERTGLIPGVFKPNFDFENYIEYALSVPMFFLVRHNRWIPVHNTPFGQFLKSGIGQWKPEPGDWPLHLTTIFTETRLKQYVEIRSMDCQKTVIGLSAPALLKGIFYDEISRKKAWELLADLSLKERLRLAAEVPVKGLQTRFKDKTIREPACELLSLAEKGLGQLTKRGLASPNEARYLWPLKKILLERGQTPAEILTKCFRCAKTKKEIRKWIITCAEI